MASTVSSDILTEKTVQSIEKIRKELIKLPSEGVDLVDRWTNVDELTKEVDHEVKTKLQEKPKSLFNRGFCIAWAKKKLVSWVDIHYLKRDFQDEPQAREILREFENESI